MNWDVSSATPGLHGQQWHPFPWRTATCQHWMLTVHHQQDWWLICTFAIHLHARSISRKTWQFLQLHLIVAAGIYTTSLKTLLLASSQQHSIVQEMVFPITTLQCFLTILWFWEAVRYLLLITRCSAGTLLYLMPPPAKPPILPTTLTSPFR